LTGRKTRRARLRGRERPSRARREPRAGTCRLSTCSAYAPYTRAPRGPPTAKLAIGEVVRSARPDQDDPTTSPPGVLCGGTCRALVDLDSLRPIDGKVLEISPVEDAVEKHDRAIASRSHGLGRDRRT